jgi:tetratricopeptide (TPR) repeat protein
LVPESEFIAGKLVSSYVAEGDYLRRRNTERASRAYRQALKLDPHSAEATRGLGRIQAGRQAAQEREQQISEHTERGLAALKREDYRKADQNFSEVLKLDPKNARAQEFREQAQALLEQKVQPMYDEGVRLYEADELAAAMAQFHQVLELHPNHADTQTFLVSATERVRSEAVDRYKRAYIFQGLGRFPEALALYRETLALLPNPREEYHQKASERIEELEKRR